MESIQDYLFAYYTQAVTNELQRLVAPGETEADDSSSSSTTTSRAQDDSDLLAKLRKVHAMQELCALLIGIGHSESIQYFHFAFVKHCRIYGVLQHLARALGYALDLDPVSRKTMDAAGVIFSLFATTPEQVNELLAEIEETSKLIDFMIESLTAKAGDVLYLHAMCHAFANLHRVSAGARGLQVVSEPAFRNISAGLYKSMHSAVMVHPIEPQLVAEYIILALAFLPSAREPDSDDGLKFLLKDGVSAFDLFLVISVCLQNYVLPAEFCTHIHALLPQSFGEKSFAQFVALKTLMTSGTPVEATLKSDDDDS